MRAPHGFVSPGCAPARRPTGDSRGEAQRVSCEASESQPGRRAQISPPLTESRCATLRVRTQFLWRELLREIVRWTSSSPVIQLSDIPCSSSPRTWNQGPYAGRKVPRYQSALPRAVRRNARDRLVRALGEKLVHLQFFSTEAIADQSVASTLRRHGISYRCGDHASGNSDVWLSPP